MSPEEFSSKQCRERGTRAANIRIVEDCYCMCLPLVQDGLDGRERMVVCNTHTLKYTLAVHRPAVSALYSTLR